MAISTINNLFDCHESSTKDSQAIKQQRLLSMQSIQRGETEKRNFDVVIYLYCGGGLPSASHVMLARWSGVLVGKMRSLGSVFHLGP